MMRFECSGCGSNNAAGLMRCPHCQTLAPGHAPAAQAAPAALPAEAPVRRQAPRTRARRPAAKGK